jgi:hypothetical protein
MLKLLDLVFLQIKLKKNAEITSSSIFTNKIKKKMLKLIILVFLYIKILKKILELLVLVFYK